MYAIVENKGKQIKLEKDSVVKIDKLESDAKGKITFDNVLLLSSATETKIGTPNIEGAKVTASILKNEKDDKIIVFKKKRRHNYRRKIGHRQEYTLIKIEDVKG
jgi:large subunit ribosomal protein L21